MADDIISTLQYRSNKDPSNASFHNLIMLTTIMGMVGLFITIVGVIGSTETVGYTSVHVVDAGLLLPGAALLFLAVQATIGLMLFSAWRHEHRRLYLLAAGGDNGA